MYSRTVSSLVSLCLHLGVLVLALYWPQDTRPLIDLSAATIDVELYTLGRPQAAGVPRPGDAPRTPGALPPTPPQVPDAPQTPPSPAAPSLPAVQPAPDPTPARPVAPDIPAIPIPPVPVAPPVPDPPARPDTPPPPPPRPDPPQTPPLRPDPPTPPTPPARPTPPPTPPARPPRPPQRNPDDVLNDALNALGGDTPPQSGGNTPPNPDAISNALGQFGSESTPGGTTAGEGGSGIGVRGTYEQVVRSRVQRFYEAPPLVSGRTPVAYVHISLGADGSVTGVRISQSSGNAAFDGAVVRAVQNASPFERPPRADLRELEIGFTY